VGVNTVILDLQRIIGAKSIKTLDELFYNLIYLVKEQLNLTITPETWWQAHLALSEVQRFITYLHDVVLAEIQGQVVIFIDEIDILLNYDFRDDLFAAIRAMFNARTDEPAFKRLTFVLLGVVSPADLVKNLRISPFNIGLGIDLQEFSLKDAGVLQDGLEKFHPGQGKAIFSHIYDWTSGHPFLTQTVCLVAANIENGYWNEEQVDDLVRQKILSPEASEERGILGAVQKQIQEHLQFVQNQILCHTRRRQLLKLYKQIYQGKEIKDDKKHSVLHNHLKLSGLVTAKEGRLQVRNEIYRHRFNLTWIKENLPFHLEYLEQIIATTMLILILLLGLFAWQQGQQSDEVLAQAYEANFNNTTNPTLRLDNLANLFGLSGYEDRVRALFDRLSPADKIALFSSTTPDLQPQVRTVVKGTYVYLSDTEDDNRVLHAMQAALDQSDEAESKILVIEISHWLDGRAALAAKNYEEAKRAYNEAIETNDQNPATHFERALVLAALENYSGALADFETAINLNQDWREQAQQTIENNNQLSTTLWGDPRSYPTLAGLIPTPTSTPTPTTTSTSPAISAASR
jgi:tetratricopeptide (TPR) repeat protein